VILLENKLLSLIGKCVCITYRIIETDQIETITSVLKEVSKDYITISGFSRHYLNRHAVLIIRIEERVE